MTTGLRTPFVVESSPFMPGTTLVEASAGTGKTFSLAMSVVRMLLERAPDGRPLVEGVGNVLVVTFTTAATDELTTRIRTLLRHAYEVYHGLPTTASESTEQLLYRVADGHDRAWVQARLAQALAELDTLAVYTIHGFCKRVLEEFALESGTAFGATLLDDETELLQAAMQDWWRRRFYTDPALAAFAVRAGWSPDTFIAPYRLWRRFPAVTLSPDVRFESAREALTEAIAGFAAVYREAEFRRCLGAMDWNAKAPCLPGAPLEALVGDIALALAGDLCAAKRVGDDVCAESLAKVATKRSGRQKEQVAALASWDVAVAAERVRAAVTRLEQGLRVDCFRHVHAWSDGEKRRRNVLAFDDLLAGLHRVLVAQGADGLLARAIRQQFQAALIDEFQDTDRFQFEIFATAFRGCPLFLIGDPKQAIYSFRGADVQAYLAAVRSADPQFTLATNYRSTGDMVDAVNAIFRQRGHAFLQDAIDFEPATATPKAGPPAVLEGDHALQWLFVRPDTGKDRPAITSVGTARQLIFTACVRHIAAQIGAGWRCGSIAVLVRSRREGVEIADMLRQHRIPAVVSGLGNVMQSAELLELQVVLEAIASPRHEARVRAALATHLWGGDAGDVLRLSQPGSEATWDALLSQLATLRERWLSHGFLQMVQDLLAARRVTERFLAFEDGERRLTNLRHLMELMQAAAVSGSLNIEGVLRWIRLNRAETSRDADVSELRLESDADAVQIYTIHKSKGLQFDLVYCPTLYAGRPHDAKGPLLVHDDDGPVFDHHEPVTPARVQQAEVERLAEDCRLAYVALTRARYRTYVGWGAVGASAPKSGAAYSALAYLLSDLPDLETSPVSERPAMVARQYLADVDAYERVVQALVRASAGRMTFEPVESALVSAVAPAEPRGPAPHFAARSLPPEPSLRTRFDTYTISSFTHLAAGGHAVSADLPRDVDDVRVPAARLDDLPPGDFRTFPAGPRAGTVLHALFESSRFEDDVRVLRERAVLPLLRNRLVADEADPRIDATARMMRAVFDSPMAPWPVSLAHVVQEKARHEWQFLLPFADARSAHTRHAIARCFEVHGGADGVRYATQLRRLGGARVHGFLTGFVDLVFEHRGQWYVVDWKSNQLGGDPAAYDRAALQRVMESQHYTLQYHLYLVALHRYLTIRLPGYDYDRHIGGAGYAFLRGFAEGATETGRGWYSDRPSRALIMALSDVMDGATDDGADHAIDHVDGEVA
jgi:exodeoxyribonuclease V beta subunit